MSKYLDNSRVLDSVWQKILRLCTMIVVLIGMFISLAVGVSIPFMIKERMIRECSGEIDYDLPVEGGIDGHLAESKITIGVLGSKYIA